MLRRKDVLIAIANDATASDIGAVALLSGANLAFATTPQRALELARGTKFSGAVMCSKMATIELCDVLRGSGCNMLVYSSQSPDRWPPGCSGVAKPASAGEVVDALSFMISRSEAASIP